MNLHLVCPSGHSWDAADPTSRCPVCGAHDISISHTEPIQGSGGTVVHQPLSATDAGSTLIGAPVPPATNTGSPASPTAADSTIAASGIPPLAIGAAPRLIEGYEILELVGRGGMGVVYRARQEGLNRVVAIKTVLAGAHARDEELQRFQSEAEAVARLRHENIVQIYQVGTVEQGGTRLPYMALEFLDGGSLDKQIAGTPWPPRRAAELIETLARAVHSAHQAGVVHRDLKPANILFANAECGMRNAESSPEPLPAGFGSDSAFRIPHSAIPKITDFGLAKRIDDDSGQTRSGSILGTPSYMAPEQARGDSGAIGTHTDVYALGAILYELLTGRPPFKATSVWDTVKQVIEQPPVPPTQLQSDAPRDLETVCLKCLAKEPHRRYESAAALADDLRRFLDDKPILARPAGELERAWRWCRRNPGLAGAAAAAVLALVGGTVVSSFFAFRAEANARRADEKARLAEENARIADVNARKADENARVANRLAVLAGQQRDVAMESFGVLLTEVQERLKDSPAMRQMRDRMVETAARGLDKLADAAAGEIVADRRFGEDRLRMARGFERLGNLSAARKQYETAIKILDAVVREHPDDRAARVHAAMARSELSGLVAATDRAAARALVASAAESLDAILKADPADTNARQALAAVSQRRGRFLQEDGDQTGAESELQRSLKLREELATAAPDDAGRQLALAEAYQALAEFVLPTNAARSGTLFEKAEEITAALTEKDPDDRRAKLQRASLAMSVGAVFERAKMPAEVEKAYRRAYRLQTELLTIDPYNAGVQFGAVQSCRKIAEVFQQAGNKSLGRDFAVTAFSRMTAVLAADPNNPGYIRAMRDIHRQNADVTLLWKGWVGARNHQRQALALTRRLVGNDPNNADLQRDLLGLTRQLADSSLQLGHNTAAREYLTQALAAAHKLNDAKAVVAITGLMAKAEGSDRRFTANSIGLDLVLVPAGTYRRGGDEPADVVAKELKEAAASLFAPEHPTHDVRITKDLYFGVTEVTRGQFRAFVEATGYVTEAEKDGRGVTQFNTDKTQRLRTMENWRADGFFGLSDDHPVVGVSWNDAVAFCAWLSKKEGKTYRLPTEAEWEYACRAGTKSRYWTGHDPESLLNGANVPDQSYLEHMGNQGHATLTGRDGHGVLAPVGEFAANPFGLYDAHGNVWEWCQDGWDPKFYEKQVADDPLAPPSGPTRVMRGGCYM